MLEVLPQVSLQDWPSLSSKIKEPDLEVEFLIGLQKKISKSDQHVVMVLFVDGLGLPY